MVSRPEVDAFEGPGKTIMLWDFEPIVAIVAINMAVVVGGLSILVEVTMLVQDVE